jgi:hypothetical protein
VARGAAQDPAARRGFARRSLRFAPRQEQPERYHQASPIELLPLGLSERLLHGTKDDVVPIEAAVLDLVKWRLRPMRNLGAIRTIFRQAPFRRIRNHKVQLTSQYAALQLLPVIHSKQIAVLFAEIIF